MLFLILAFVATQNVAKAAGTQTPPGEGHDFSAGGEAYHLSGENLAHARSLGRIRASIHFGSELWNLAVLTLLLSSGAVSQLARRIESATNRRWLHAGLFSAVMVAILFVTAEMPVLGLGHFFSRRYGISVESWGAWLIDQPKSLALEIALESPALATLYGLMHWNWSRRLYWIWFWAGSVPAVVLGAFLLPQIIEPMYYRFEPLSRSHPQLVTELEKVVAHTGTAIPPNRMFLMKASEKSNGLNAYVSGMGSSKRIVVWDTTADRMPTDEILFVFGHESGHYVLNHIVKGLALGLIGIFLLFGLTVWLGEWMVRQWGSGWAVPSLTALPGLAVILLTVALLEVATEPIENAVSRAVEHQADVYGQEAIHGIVDDPKRVATSAFNHLGVAYLEDPEPNRLLVFWTYDHPSIQSRATFAEHYDPWADGNSPRYFSK